MITKKITSNDNINDNTQHVQGKMITFADCEKMITSNDNNPTVDRKNDNTVHKCYHI